MTPELHFLNGLDYFVLVVYMLMILFAGIYVAKFNKATTDYFKGDGKIPWQLSAMSLFISGFSAYMFVGAAGLTYKNGLGAFFLFTFAFPAYMLGYFIFGPLWRRTRLDTPLQFVTKRFSKGTTYFYTLMAVLPNTLVLGIMIYTLCIFISTALGISNLNFDLGFAVLNGFEMTILVTGIFITIYTTLGGLWAVMVTDGIQMIIVVLVSIVMIPMAFLLLGDGNILEGVSRLKLEAPEGYFDLNLDGKPFLFWPSWFVYIIFGYNVHWHIAQRYYSVPDERDTRKMAMWCGVLSLIMPVMWLLPVAVSPILFPNIEQMWPELADPTEASFITVALAILPHGMLGLLAAAILAATMSSTDTLFNWLSAVMTKDIFVPIMEKTTGRVPREKIQLWFGKATVAALGIISIWVAFNVQRFGGAFEVSLRANSLYKHTLFLPVFLGLLMTRTPWWSAMASVAVGMVTVLGVGVFASIATGVGLSPMNILFADVEAHWFGFTLYRYELNAILGLSSAAIVFLTSRFFDNRQGEFGTRIRAFEKDLRTPAYAESEARVGPEGLMAYKLMGYLSLVLGALLIIFTFLTLERSGWLNTVTGTLAIALGAGILAAVHRYEKKHLQR
jgi:SSS family solute:Na+ symporter